MAKHVKPPKPLTYKQQKAFDRREKRLTEQREQQGESVANTLLLIGVLVVILGIAAGGLALMLYTGALK